MKKLILILALGMTAQIVQAHDFSINAECGSALDQEVDDTCRATHTCSMKDYDGHVEVNDIKELQSFEGGFGHTHTIFRIEFGGGHADVDSSVEGCTIKHLLFNK